MPLGLDARRSRLLPQTLTPGRRGLLWFVLALVMGQLVACAQPLNRSPQAVIIPTAAPTTLPTPTVFILNSDALYNEGQWRSGTTRQDFASLPAGSILPPAPTGEGERGVSLLLDPHTILPGELYRQGGQFSPAILMLGADPAAWGALPLQLAQAGFIVLTLQTEPLTPARQVDAMLQSLIAIPGVDAGAVGLVGEARAADLAMLGCAVNSLCDALALFSPLSRDTLLNMLPSFGARPLWLAASMSDGEAHAAARSLHQGATGPAHLELLETGRGAALLDAKPGLGEQLVDWFALHLHSSE